jgi:uncharacterized protein (TIGR03437 family)
MNRIKFFRLGVRVMLGSMAMAQAQQTAAIVGAAYSAPVPIIIAPGALTTIYVQGIGNTINAPVFASGLPLPAKLSGISVSLTQTTAPLGPIPVPILAIFPVPACRSAVFQSCGKLTGINVQIPFEMVPVNSGVEVANFNYVQLTVQEDGGAQVTIEATSVFDRIHVLLTGDTLKNPGAATVARPIPTNTGGPIVTHADGSMVSAIDPADVGETLIMWATGLGWMLPLPRTGEATPNPAPTEPVGIRFDYVGNASPSLPLYQNATVPGFLTPGSVGLYQVNFVVPPLPAGYLIPCVGPFISNLTVSIGQKTSFDGAGICVRIPAAQ